MMFGYADALYYENANGTPGTPPSNQIENPNPQASSNNFYTQDGYGGGSYTRRGQRIMGAAVCTPALVPATTAGLPVWAWFGRRGVPAFR